ncbi:MAG: homoserine kinase [Nanoarchaeota archaeon]
MSILYHSTNRDFSGFKDRVTFKEALFTGMAPDNGLFMPDNIPQFSKEQIIAMKGKPYQEVAFEVLNKFLAGDIEEKQLREITAKAYNFEVPLEEPEKGTYILRLDKGPTCSFKDFAARFMAGIMQRLNPKESITILVATSGDTGSAIGEAFRGIPGTRVYILYPEDEVTYVQKRQLDSIGGNVKAISIKGKFDDCQKLVKEAFADSELSSLSLTSANSINIARILPQIAYYFYAYANTAENFESIVFSVPSGNFGNSLGCEIARRMGLPVEKLIIATNENNEFPEFLNTGIYQKIEPSRKCLSNAMNVGNPSNLARYFDLYGGNLDKDGIAHKMPDLNEMRKHIFSAAISDEETIETIREFYRKYNLIIEPHGAVAVKALQKYSENNKFSKAVCIETADPAKFPETIEKALGITPSTPHQLANINDGMHDTLPADYNSLKQYLLHNAEWVKVFAPATIGNIGPGFDILGMAVKGLGDIVEARKTDSGVKITHIESKAELSNDPEKNTAGIAAMETLKLLGEKGGVEIRLKKGLPLGSGLGSSAASAAAAAYAVNILYGNKLSKDELIMPVTKAEEAVSGGFFADNTAPALLGGAILIRTYEPLDVTKIGSIKNLKIILVTPDIVVLTKEARGILPKDVPMQDFVFNMANSCMITMAFAKGDYDLFARSLNDRIIEPVRSRLIKGFEDVKNAALSKGADGVAISGSGPTLFAITNSSEKAEKIKNAMVSAFAQHGISSESIVTEMNNEGAKQI